MHLVIGAPLTLTLAWGVGAGDWGGSIPGDEISRSPGAAPMHVDLAVHGVRGLSPVVLGGVLLGGVATRSCWGLAATERGVASATYRGVRLQDGELVDQKHTLQYKLLIMHS